MKTIQKTGTGKLCNGRPIANYPDTSEKCIKRISCGKHNSKLQPHRKKENETAIITANELTKDEEYELQVDNEKKQLCTDIYVNIHEQKYEMLIDSGAEISTISTEYEEAILKSDKSTPTLPLTGMTMHNATGDKSIKVNRQLLIPLSAKNTLIHTPFIVGSTVFKRTRNHL